MTALDLRAMTRFEVEGIQLGIVFLETQQGYAVERPYIPYDRMPRIPDQPTLLSAKMDTPVQAADIIAHMNGNAAVKTTVENDVVIIYFDDSKRVAHPKDHRNSVGPLRFPNAEPY